MKKILFGILTLLLSLSFNQDSYSASGTKTGNTTYFATSSGAQTSGDCVKIDANGNHVANGAPCAPYISTNAILIATSTVNYTNGIWRLDFSSGFGAPPLFYRPNNSACSLNSGNGDNGSQVKSADNKCWLAQFPDGVVDVTQFGTDKTGVADAVGPVNAAFALGSNHTFVFPPGTYTIKSQSASPYPLVVGPVGFKLLGTSGSRLSNIKISGIGAVIATDSSNNNLTRMIFDYIDKLEVNGLTFLMNTTGLPSGSEPSGSVLLHLRDASFTNISFTGNWGGSTRQPFAFAGDWLENIQFNHIVASAISGCFDFAFVHQLSITNIIMTGADDDGVYGNSRSPCISIAYDTAFITNYPTVVSFETTLGMSIANNNIQGFAKGIELRAGQNYQIIGNTLGPNGGTANPITGPGNGAGVFIVSDGTPSDTDPVINVVVNGNTFDRNGATVAGAGILLDTTSATELFGNFNFTGNIFNNNWDTGIGLTSTNYIANSLTIGPNTLIGANQTTGYDTGVYTYSGTPTLPGMITAANCSGQPSNSIIATTGTGVLLLCP